MRCDVGNGPAALRIKTQTLPRNLVEWSGNRFRKFWIGLTNGFTGRRPLREGFDQSDAQRPHVSGSGETGRGHLRRAIDAWLPCRDVPISSGADSVTRKLQVV